MPKQKFEPGVVRDFLFSLPEKARAEVYSRLILLAGQIEDVRNSRQSEQVSSLLIANDRWGAYAALVRTACLLDFIFAWPYRHSAKDVSTTARNRGADSAAIEKEFSQRERDFKRAAEIWQKIRRSKLRNDQLVAKLEQINSL